MKSLRDDPKRLETDARSCTMRQAEKDLVRYIPRLKRLALGKNASLSASLSGEEIDFLADPLKELSKGFTRERALAGKAYLSDTRNLAAYLLYFWPVSYMQTRLVFERLLPPHALDNAAILDLGCGPAPASFAAFDCGAARVVAADANRAATAIAQKLAATTGKKLAPVFWDGVKSMTLPPGSFDLIIMSHLVNEMWAGHPERIRLRAESILGMAGSLANEGMLMIIDPALFSTTRDLLALRDVLVGEGLTVISPCLRQKNCPCLEEPKATCHADFSWNPPPFLSRLAHRARIGKESLPFSCLVLTRTGRKAPVQTGRRIFRVVSEKMLSKSGRIRYFVCGREGRFTLSAKPEGNESWKKTFTALKRYDVIVIEGTQKRENGEGLVRESLCEKITLWR